MIELKDLLGRFRTLADSLEGNTELVRQAISRNIGADIPKDKIEIKNGTVYLNIRPAYKTELLIKKEKILSELAEALSRPPEDIR